MEALIMKIFSEQWIIYWLFFLIVGGFIWKWIPFIIAQFEKQQTTFIETLKELQTAHREDMDTISQVFIAQIKESNANHLITHGKLDEIKNLIKK